MVKLGTLNFLCCLIQRSSSACTTDYLRKGCVQGHVTSLNFGETSDNILETVQDRQLQWKIRPNRKSYVSYRMAQLLVNFSDIQGA